MQNSTPISQTGERILETNKVLKNTYTLMSMTLLFSAAMAGLAMFLQVPHMVSLGTSVVALLLLWFVLPRVDESAAGLGVVFAVTGLLGFGVGPMVSYYLSLPHGAATVMTAMGGTGAIFLALSGYVLTTKKDFSFMGGMLMVGMIVVLGAALIGIFVNMPAMQLMISAAIVLLMSGFILFETSRIITGGETNYIRATVSLFLSILNIFTSLLHILGVAGDD